MVPIQGLLTTESSAEPTGSSQEALVGHVREASPCPPACALPPLDVPFRALESAMCARRVCWCGRLRVAPSPENLGLPCPTGHVHSRRSVNSCPGVKDVYSLPCFCCPEPTAFNSRYTQKPFPDPWQKPGWKLQPPQRTMR